MNGKSVVSLSASIAAHALLFLVLLSLPAASVVKPVAPIEMQLEEIVEATQTQAVQKQPIAKKVMQKQNIVAQKQTQPTNEKAVKQELVSTPKAVAKQPEPQRQAVAKQAEEPSAKKSVKNSDTDQVRLYLSRVRAKIQKNLLYPNNAKRINLEGTTTVKFCLAYDGSVREHEIKIVASSGSSILDRAAIASVMDAAPFDKPPETSNGKMELTLPVVFSLKTS